MRALGVVCTPNEVLLALCEDGSLLDSDPPRLEPPANLDVGRALWEFIDEVRRALGVLTPDRIGVLLPETYGYQATHAQMMPRIVLETLVRLAAERAEIPTDLVSRPTVRSVLGLSRKEALDNHVSAVFGEPVGKYWKKGRGLAALTARTIEETY